MDIVLIVDDNPIVLGALASTLSKTFSSQFKVITANNGKEAVQILEKAAISLVVTDLVMPEIDGFELLAYINEHYPSMPCFVMSAAYEDSDIKNRIPQDNLKFFVKPLIPKTFGPEIINAINANKKNKKATGISVINFLLMIEMEMRTCLFEAVLPNGKKSLFYFKNGVLFQAIYEDLKGEDAVIAVIAQGTALFKFKTLPSKQIPRKIDKNLEQMIAETLKQYVDKKETDEIPQADAGFHKEKGPVERLELSGKMLLRTGSGRRITVTNLSRREIQFKTHAKHTATPGTFLTLEFHLDDKLYSLISREVTVTQIQENNILAEFADRNHYDRLGPYIAFNGFSNERIY